jgi:hypothetical protein
MPTQPISARATEDGLLFDEVDSWMAGITCKVEGQHARRVMH